MSGLTDAEADAFAIRDRSDRIYARETVEMLLRDEWEPGDDVDRDDSVRGLALFLLENRRPA